MPLTVKLRQGHRYKQWNQLFLACNCGSDVFAVHAGDVLQGNSFGTFDLTSACVGAVAKAFEIHLVDHVEYTLLGFYLTLGQKGQLAHFGRDEEHGRSILAGGHAGSATDAGGGSEGLVGIAFVHGQAVCILSSTCVDADVATGLDDAVECAAVHHKIFDDGKRFGPPWFDENGVAILEGAHVELAGGDLTLRAVGLSVDVERAHAADALAAIVVECYGLIAFEDEAFVEDVQHFQEGHVGRDIGNGILNNLPCILRAALAPDLQGEFHSMFSHAF
jgi:hypothetical protein